MTYQQVTGDLKFREAFDIWIAQREMKPAAALMPSKGVKYLKDTSLEDLRDCALALEKFFAQLTLAEIHPGHLMAYQNARAFCNNALCVQGAWEKTCGAGRIRKEINLMIRLLTAARLWGDEQENDLVKVQAEEADVPRAMDTEQQQALLAAAGSRENWQVMFWYAIVALQTAAATNELRDLKVGDIMIGSSGYEMIQIRWVSAKNKYRIRSVPLVGQSVWAMENLVRRAASLGSKALNHHLFPFRIARGIWDPTRPMSDTGFNKTWREIRKAAGIPWLRLYDLRHTGITRMAEAGVPIDVAMSLVGHMTLQMHNHYTTIQQGAKRKWMQAAWDAEPLAANAERPKPPQRENQTGNGFAQKFARRA